MQNYVKYFRKKLNDKIELSLIEIKSEKQRSSHEIFVL